jgi:hypothetical protein
MKAFKNIKVYLYFLLPKKNSTMPRCFYYSVRLVEGVLK